MFWFLSHTIRMCTTMEHRGPPLFGLLALVTFALMATTVHADLSYSFPEEMKRGSVIGNIAKDLGLDVTRLSARKARLVSEEDPKQYCDLNLKTGELIIADRIDREELCLEKLTCLLRLELMLENPLELHRIALQIQDINDNSPMFLKDSIKLEISENADKGSRFRVNEAHDVDAGQNAVTGYTLERNSNFVLSVNPNKDGGRNVELILDKELDREQKQDITLVLSASDGGTPPRSGTVAIHVTVLDANDNAPVFSQEVYKANLSENAPLDTVVVKVSATDADEGPNGEISYEFSRVSSKARKIFSLNSLTGEIKVISTIDFEDEQKYEMRIEGKDGFGLSTDARVLIEITDLNDNAPIIAVQSLNNHIPEDVSPGTEVGIINVQDRDSDENRRVRCFIQENVPFKLIPSIKNYYSLVTTGALDRELVSEYNFTVIANDAGSPPLSSSKKLHLSVADVNDNAPVFDKLLYTAQITENNKPGYSVCSVKARDPDWRQNGTIMYSLATGEVNGLPVSSLLSINGDTGIIHVVKSVDYEHLKSFKVYAIARDSGSPPLSSNVTVSVLITDENDNPPQILYPTPQGSSLMTELVPKTVLAGSLVSKIIAVDADSGQNAWLSYEIIKSSDPGLFTIGVYSGEIRTQRDISENDGMKQNLIVSVRDNGQPTLSVTCALHVLISDSFAEIPEINDKYDESNSKLTYYLIIALVSVSTFFLTFIIVTVAVRFCRRGKPRLLFDGAVAIPSAYLPPNYADVDGTGTLRSCYNYDTYMTTGSRTSDFKFVTSYNDGTMPTTLTLKKSPTAAVDHNELFQAPDMSAQVQCLWYYSVKHSWLFFRGTLLQLCVLSLYTVLYVFFPGHSGNYLLGLILSYIVLYSILLLKGFQLAV